MTDDLAAAIARVRKDEENDDELWGHDLRRHQTDVETICDACERQAQEIALDRSFLISCPYCFEPMERRSASQQISHLIHCADKLIGETRNEQTKQAQEIARLREALEKQNRLAPCRDAPRPRFQEEP